MVRRGEVFWVQLDPTVGSEIQKTRPCVIVSPSEIHDHLKTAIIAPLTSAGRPAPFRVPVTFGDKDGLVLLDQIRVVDKRRLVKSMGHLSNEVLSDILSVLQEIFME
ncbi:type II toxin-antitoxin system PemK/MazF family toxin [Neisseria sp. Dent CA1/247]|nr:type II toxin-antitoxin system PemK/MazF family toxin [Neisseria sp. Dent CA1/247]QMT36826.1 type II toxin-antitoxin system PemK/MazF family toxin [Neisseria wadsworthii]UOO78284.1 type II toxin-antitoxin system PemK/MazF family toxin [Neisseria sp. Dent CA1/247]